MAYQVIARKWRPQVFEEVIFQDHVSRTIQNSISSGRISHAYLFAGPRGVGKTTMARILARALNCENGPTPSPCGTCRNCVEIRNGGSFDVIEIDGASNNGVDDIRDLREKVNFAPVRGRYKVYIIDEVHMVSTSGFNALLKTLEEPPAHVVFIFATTEIHKIPETILSRCQKFFFKKIPVDAIVSHLARIVEKEGYNISQSALYPLARASAGGMRDAQSLLDQVISFSGAEGDTEIGEDDALSVLGIVPLESFGRMIEAVAEGDSRGAIEEVRRITEMGVDIPRYSSGLLDVLRTLRLAASGILDREILGMSPEEIGLLKGLSGKFHDEELSRMFHIASNLVTDLRFSPDGRIPLEMALLDMIAVRKAPSLSAIVRRLTAEADRNVLPELQTEISHTGMSPVQDQAPARSNEKIESKPAEKKPLRLHDEWTAFIRDLEKDRAYIAMILKESSVEINGDELILRFNGGMGSSYYAKMLDRDGLAQITQGMSARLGKDLRLVIRGEVPPEEGPARMEDESAGKKPDTMKETNTAAAAKDPAVEKIRDAFHGEIVNKGDK